MYGVARKSADLLRMSLVTSAAMLAICLLALVETTNKAEAKDSLPQNGKIAFWNLTDYEIFTVDPDGTNLSQLTDDPVSKDLGSDPAWSPDGTKIAYVSFGPRITVMDADGSNKRKLTMDGRRTRFESPTWSADGTQLAFSTSTPMQSITPDIYTSDTDGSDLTNLTKNPENDESEPDYSPNGSQMCFTGGNFKTGFGIYIANSDGSNPTRLVGDEPPESLYWSCDWSPDGTKIAYTYPPDRHGGEEWAEDVYVINADGSGKINLTKSPDVTEGDPNWSPDGTKITFARARDGDYDIYTMDADGSDVAQVTNLPGNEYTPDWQPLTQKSRSITVAQPDTGGPSLLWVASALLFFSGGSLLYAVLRPSM